MGENSVMSSSVISNIENSVLNSAYGYCSTAQSSEYKIIYFYNSEGSRIYPDNISASSNNTFILPVIFSNGNSYSSAKLRLYKSSSGYYDFSSYTGALPLGIFGPAAVFIAFEIGDEGYHYYILNNKLDTAVGDPTGSGNTTTARNIGGSTYGIPKYIITDHLIKSNSSALSAWGSESGSTTINLSSAISNYTNVASHYYPVSMVSWRGQNKYYIPNRLYMTSVGEGTCVISYRNVAPIAKTASTAGYVSVKILWEYYD